MSILPCANNYENAGGQRNKKFLVSEKKLFLLFLVHFRSEKHGYCKNAPKKEALSAGSPLFEAK